MQGLGAAEQNGLEKRNKSAVTYSAQDQSLANAPVRIGIARSPKL